jgi:hypothetical protein
MTDGVDPHASRTELTGQRLAEVNQGTLEFLSGPATRLPTVGTAQVPPP